jgi:tRNA A-37 threonylcarbamoyl transferase component Bud32
VVGEGQTLDGTYHLQRLIGEGGMGVVYEATHARLAGRYAIKVLLPELCAKAEIRARFDREARITSLLQHPNIVQVIDHNSTVDGTSYLVMEYLSGESLAWRLARDGQLTIPATVDVVDQIAAGLAAAHARGIVHRDLKPDNLFLVPVEGRATELVKILDFGISKVSWGLDAMDREICGTPQYMAPEQAEGRVADVDASTDQYALAVIAYELLTGRNPFVADTTEAMLARVLADIVPPTGLSGAVDSVLLRALSKDKALRFPSVTAFADGLRAAARAPLSIEVVTPEHAAPLAVSLRRARPAARRMRLGFALAAIAVTSFLGTGAAHRAPRPDRVGARPSATPFATGPKTTTARLPTVEPVLATAVDVSPGPESAAAATVTTSAPASRAGRTPPIRRARGGRPTVDDSPVLALPTAPARRPAAPALTPDEDATLPPSSF